MHKFKDWEYLLIYLFFITLAEIAVSFVNPLTGIIFHLIILIILFIHSGVISNEEFLLNYMNRIFMREKKKPSTLINSFLDEGQKLSSILLALTLAPLIRILSLVMPLSHFKPIQWFIIIGVAIYLAFFIILIQQKINIKECGLKLPTKKNLPIEIGIIILGIPLGFSEYYILQPTPFIDVISIENLILAILILFIATGLMEELIFRGLIQKKSIDLIGVWPGIFYVTLLFAVLHIGNLSLLDVLLVFCIGGLYAVVVKVTKTIIGVSISHTIVNVFLFIILTLKLI